jgi:pimeloyl-ACP methyl ester carboxylesterase
VAPPGAFVDVGGHRLHTICRGEGTPLVLFESGVAASSLSWALVQPEVAKFTRVCAYDRAGLAWSDPPSCPRTYGRIIEELAAVVSHADTGAPHVLVGHSFGSFVVRAYAALHPGQVSAVVLVDPPTDWLTVTPRRVRMMRGGIYLSRIGALLARLGVVRACLALLTGGAPAAPRQFVKVFGPTAAATLERLVGEVRKLPPEVHPLVKAHWCQPKCFHAMADYLRAFERDRATMAALTPPRDVSVVVISSGKQPPEQLARHRALTAGSIGGRHIVAARSGHWIQFDEPELIVAAVRELVDRARS